MPLVRIRLVNGDCWCEDGVVMTVPLEQAIAAAKEFLSDIAAAIVAGNITSGSYSKGDIELIHLDGSVVSLIQAEVELKAQQEYEHYTLEDLSKHLWEYYKAVHWGIPPRHVDMTDRNAVMASLMGLERYMAERQSSPDGRRQLRDEGWTIHDSIETECLHSVDVDRVCQLVIHRD